MWRLYGIFARVRDGVNTGNNKCKAAVSQDERIAKWKEAVMKVIHKVIARQHICNALALLAFFATAAPGADARHRASKPSEQPATVVAHMPLSGYPTSQMDLRENGGKQYLYIGVNSHEGLTVVDVTNPDQPNVIKRLAWPNEASTGRLQLVSGGLALAEGSDSEAAAADPAPPTWTLKVLDLSNPANPRAILSFSGVTGTLDDEAHNLVYITNREGLWILRNNQALVAAAKRHACSSDDAYNDVASCE
jgi:LVIVD repeat